MVQYLAGHDAEPKRIGLYYNFDPSPMTAGHYIPQVLASQHRFLQWTNSLNIRINWRISMQCLRVRQECSWTTHVGSGIELRLTDGLTVHSLRVPLCIFRIPTPKSRLGGFSQPCDQKAHLADRILWRILTLLIRYAVSSGQNCTEAAPLKCAGSEATLTDRFFYR